MFTPSGRATWCITVHAAIGRKSADNGSEHSALDGQTGTRHSQLNRSLAIHKLHLLLPGRIQSTSGSSPHGLQDLAQSTELYIRDRSSSVKRRMWRQDAEPTTHLRPPSSSLLSGNSFSPPGGMHSYLNRLKSTPRVKINGQEF